MEYFGLGDEIDYSTYNGLVYLLRKFKRLTSDLRLGDSSISSDYGVYSVTGGLTSVGGNFILEDNVTISSSDVLLNCFYTFYFTVVDVNLSGTVNRRVISVTGDTGDNGELEVVLEPSLLESDEVILPDFKVDIVFDPHEYYTPVSSLDITLTVDKEYIAVGESNTVTATVLDDSGEPVEDLTLQFSFNGDIVTDITDEEGIASAEYIGTGAGWVNVLVNGKSIQFYDGSVLITEVTGNSITFGDWTPQWLVTNGDVVIDWGDGTQSTVNNPTRPLTHTYTDGRSSHDIAFLGEVTGLGSYCFKGCTGLTSVTIPSSITSLGEMCFINCSGLTSVVIPDSVVSLGRSCFWMCTGLTSITIPDNVSTIGELCFRGCYSLIDYQLYWTGNNIITYDSSKMQNNTNTVFTIPYGETSNYTSRGYPASKLLERGYHLTITTNRAIIETSETSTVTAKLTDTGVALAGETLTYTIKHGATIIDTGTDTTDNNGEIEIPYTGTGIGQIEIIVTYDTIQETIRIIDAVFKDIGTTTKHGVWTSTDFTDATRITRTNGYTILTPQDDYDSQTENISLTDFAVEFNCSLTYTTGTSQNAFLRMLASSNRSFHPDKLGIQSNKWYNLRFVVRNGEIKAFVDDVEKSSESISEVTAFRMVLNNNFVSRMKYNNFVVYPVDSEPVHTYSLSISSNKQSILTSESVTLTGTLLMDSTPYTGQSVALYDGSTLIDTLTTDSNGEYSKTISGLSAGTHTFKAVNTNAESSTVSVTVSEPTPVHNYSITITGDSIIQTGDTDNITATLKDNGVAVSGETLTYEIKHGSTIIDSGTDTTDSNGQITITYTGTGAGDIDVIVSYGSLEETYEVTDYIRYDDATSDKTSNYQYNNLNSHTFSTDKYIAERTMGASSSTYYSPIYPSDTLPTNYEISVDMLAIAKEQDKQFGLCVSNEYTQTYSGTNQCFLYANSNRTALGYRVNGSLTNYGESSSYNTNTWYTFKITVNGTSVSSQILNGGTVVQSWNGTLSNIQSWKKIMIITGGQANTVHWKNLKIKAL